MRSLTSGAISASITGTSLVRARRTVTGVAGSDVTVPPYKLWIRRPPRRHQRRRAAAPKNHRPSACRKLLGLGRAHLLGQRLGRGVFAARLTAGREDELAKSVGRGDVVHVDVVARRQLAVQDLLAQRVLDLVLHRAAQRT